MPLLPARAAPLAAAASLAALLALQWQVGHRGWQPGYGLTRELPALVAGDEPHYLVSLSALRAGEGLEVRAAYERSRGGGLDAGRAFRGQLIDHHSLLFDRASGAWGRWSEVYDVRGRTPCAPGALCSPFPASRPELAVRPGVVEVGAHPIAFPALVAAAIAPLAPADADVEARAIEAVMLLAWLGAAATCFAGRRAGMPWGASIAASWLVGAASTWLVYGRSFFAETAIGVALILGLWALQAGRAALVGLAIVAAAAVKPNFALVGGAWILERLWARRPREAVWIACIAAAGGIALLAFNWQTARTLVVAGRDPWNWALGTGPLAYTLLSDQHGLLYFVPWTLVPAFALLRSRPTLAPPADAASALLRQIALPTLVHLGVLALNRNGDGWCYGPRYWVPLLPLLALATVEVARRRGRGIRATVVALAAVALLFAVPAALLYKDSFVGVPFALLLSRP